MTDTTKVMLSEFEAMLINNTEWILTKHVIIQKVSDLLATQTEQINHHFTEKIEGEVFPEMLKCHPKLSKGEKYLNLPYVILDYPAVFSRTDTFALRTMFWWGNFISVTLQLSGKYKLFYQEKLLKNIVGADESFYISTGNEEWQNHFEADNYTPVSMLDTEDLNKKIVQPSFIKIALKYDLSEWLHINALLKETYSKFAFMLTR